MSAFFPVSQEDLNYLLSRDEKLAEAISIIGPIQRSVRTGAFQGLIHAICGQQISGKAHQSIWKRVCERFNPDDAAGIAAASHEDLRVCGLSLRKAAYISNIAGLFSKGVLQEQELLNMRDEDLRSSLLTLPGVGPWTVDMLLIFTFLRKNILSRGDLGIQRGLRMLYKQKDISPALFDSYYKRFSPLASIASLYLWEVASGKYPHWKDPPANKKDQD